MQLTAVMQSASHATYCIHKASRQLVALTAVATFPCGIVLVVVYTSAVRGVWYGGGGSWVHGCGMELSAKNAVAHIHTDDGGLWVR